MKEDMPKSSSEASYTSLALSRGRAAFWMACLSDSLHALIFFLCCFLQVGPRPRPPFRLGCRCQPAAKPGQRRRRRGRRWLACGVARRGTAAAQGSADSCGPAGARRHLRGPRGVVGRQGDGRRPRRAGQGGPGRRLGSPCSGGRAGGPEGAHARRLAAGRHPRRAQGRRPREARRAPKSG